ncbi:hypothetical protein ZWY2020_028302 [Hordeum vulgare]|nr:hypothetical protein ZWY2020_035581 [Hordeum vulgare]KAI5013348.1 hypothetical protein ZWY2020_028302 [Hordeum vulgare]
MKNSNQTRGLVLLLLVLGCLTAHSNCRSMDEMVDEEKIIVPPCRFCLKNKELIPRSPLPWCCIIEGGLCYKTKVECQINCGC